MAKSPKETAAIQDPVATGRAFLQQIEDAGLGQMQGMGTAWFEAMADLNSEVVSFVAERIKEDVKTQHELLHCTSVEEFQKAQTAFLEKAFKQYTEETGKLVKMGLDMMPNGINETKNTPL